MAPMWLTVVAWIYLAICFGCAAVIACDIFVNGRRQSMGVMNVVFPITALYFGPLAVAFYLRWGRAAADMTTAPMAMSHASVPQTEVTPAAGGLRVPDAQHAHGGMTGAREKPWWAMMATEVSHCGSGCVLGDVISEFVIFALALTIAGSTLGAEYVGDYVLALAFGIAFQYFAIAPMRVDGGHGVRSLSRAASADAELGRVLAAHAGRHDCRVRDVMAGKRLAD
jgi:hypothetical protein